PRTLVIGLQDIHELGQDQVREDQFVLSCEECSRSACLTGGITRQVADEDVGIQQRSHRRPAARFRHVSARTRDHEAPRFPDGTGTLPASSRKSGTFARTALPSRTRNKTRSPALSWSDYRTDFGSVTC